MGLRATNNSLSVTAHLGDSAILLAFDLPADKIEKLAGFSIKCTTPSNGPYPTNTYFLQNMLSFDNAISREHDLTSVKTYGSDRAPFQSFHWIHFPSAGPGSYTYTVYASYFDSNGAPKLGPSCTLNVDLSYQTFTGLELGFTRGYVSSQAYADRFKNKPIRKMPKSMDFDTTPFQKQYQWLGSHARKIIFNFLSECQTDPTVNLDIFSYDFDEPDIIRVLSKLGNKVRVLQDNAILHTGPNALEPLTVQVLKNSGVNVKMGHFSRFSHDKVMIQKRNGRANKVLTGSANFSIRGLYVQANSVMLLDDPAIAELYERVFELSFGLDFSQPSAATDQFAKSSIASSWQNAASNPKLPPVSFCFSPHGTTPNPVSLKKVSESILAAKSSVMFAVMEMTGGGEVTSDLKDLGKRSEILSLGTIESNSELNLFSQGKNTSVASFNYLKKNAPAPFQEEISGGTGQVIHHKFIVCDFNDASPVVYCGSSNLSLGGEQQNGDNLISINNDKIATYYAVEALRLYDHFEFRSLHQNSTPEKPMQLDATDKWVKPYYDPKNIKYTKRQLLIH